MNRKIVSYIFTLLSLIFIFFLINNNDIVLDSVSFSIYIWKNNLFPTLFPFLVISSILIDLNIINTFGNLISKPISKIFKISKESVIVFISSLFSGFPTGAKLTTNLVEKKIISNNEASKLLMFTSFANPLFILGFIYSLIPIKKVVYTILISHTLGGILVGIIFRNSVELNNNLKEYKKEEILSFGTIFSKSIKDSLNTMFLLLGIITIFSLIVAFFEISFYIDPLIKSIISGILEMTQGIKNISNLNISLLFKTILITQILSFNGISIHMQVLSIISLEKIKYKPYFVARIIHVIIATMLALLFYNIL